MNRPFLLVGLAGLVACTSSGTLAEDDGGITDATTTADAGAPPDVHADATHEASSSDVYEDEVSLDGGTCAALGTTPTEIAGSITSNMALTCDHVYALTGIVLVEPPATLTIAAGTTLLMNDGASLIVEPGAKIVAVGTRDLPIVFTSARPVAQRAPGDWGTLALVGTAPGNWGLDGTGIPITKHVPDANDWPGGPFPLEAGNTDTSPTAYADSSGTLKYVRLEYGGSPKAPNPALDGGFFSASRETLGMYGVGVGTRIDFVEIRQALFGCLFAEGGAFDATHLICQWGGDTSFGLTRGNKSRVQFVVVQSNPNGDNNAAEGLGIKGPFDNNQQPPLTDPRIYNVTACGTNGTGSIKVPFALLMKRQPAGQVYNFIGTAFRAGLGMQSGGGLDGGLGLATTQLRNSVLFGNFDPRLGDAAASSNIALPTGNDTDLVAWFGNAQWHNSTSDPGISTCADPNTMSLAPAHSVTSNAATPPNDGFFDPTASYIGAFKDASDDWATGSWVVWSDR